MVFMYLHLNKKGWNILNSAKPGALGGKYIYIGPKNVV